MLHVAGVHFWTASILPALVGTFLPFWLNPPGFTFRWLNALAFVGATILFHSGFSCLQSWINSEVHKRSKMILTTAIASLVVGCIIGLVLNAGLSLHDGVYNGIFVLYGLAALFVGVLYVVPPLCFARRLGGEVVLAQGLGLIPLLGAYLVQVGDITRTVYLASMPIVVATGVWIWVDELVTRNDDETFGRNTMVRLFPYRFSRRYGTLILILACYLSLAAAIIVRRSLPVWSLFTLLSFWPAGALVLTCWREPIIETAANRLQSNAIGMHILLCFGILISIVIAHATGYRR